LKRDGADIGDYNTDEDWAGFLDYAAECMADTIANIPKMTGKETTTGTMPIRYRRKSTASDGGISTWNNRSKPEKRVEAEVFERVSGYENWDCDLRMALKEWLLAALTSGFNPFGMVPR
jgi:hypothetical protein